MPNYIPMSGERLGNDEVVVSCMLLYVWLIGVNKSFAAQCNRAKKSKKEDDTENIKA
jgi:hypothetical protein